MFASDYDFRLSPTDGKRMAIAGVFPPAYRPALDLRETERAIRYIKSRFQDLLAGALNLTRVSAPLFVASGSGVNDDLNGIERPVSFPLNGIDAEAEIVQSLAKWKRLALARYGFAAGEGLYTDMNAIRPDEEPDNLHSFYVDQWDWEKVIHPEERTEEMLRATVRPIYAAIRRMAEDVRERFPALPRLDLPEEIAFIHSAELLRRYPGEPASAREHRACREHGAVFVIGVGAPLADGQPHDGRAPDYDDWISETGPGRRGLNGDIIVRHPALGCTLELSSMGIRVNAESLRSQLAARRMSARESLSWHRRLLAGELPQTIGGGIGQSRLCMFLLQKAHIGEVQAGIWSESVNAEAAERGITLL